MYFGSVRFFKHLIIAVIALLIIVPCVICGVLTVQKNEQEQEIAELRQEVGALRLNGSKESYTAEELMELYKTALAEKDEFFKLLYGYDGARYANAAGLKEENGEEEKDSENSQEASSGGVINAVTVTSTENGDEKEVPDEAVPAYQRMFPELYAEGTADIVYDADMDCVYLTFDDGPSKYTENILYYLDLYDIKATFFVVPDGTEQCAARLRKIADAGHTIGVHTASHVYNDIYASVEDYLSDFELAYNRIYEATGIKCRLFRFPGGSINDFNGDISEELIAEMTRRGFIYFDWNVDSRDALGATWTEMYNTVLNETAEANRAVILMHDYNGGYGTVLVLEDIIRALISDQRGYKLKPLTESVKPIQF